MAELIMHYADLGNPLFLSLTSFSKYMTQEEVKKFFGHVKDKRDRALFALIYHYGLRVSKACRLQLSDLDFQRNKIFIHRCKGSISGEKPLWHDTKKVLKAYL